MRKKISTLNDAAKERLRVIEYLQQPSATYVAAAEMFEIHETTAAEWWRIYQEEGVEGLKRPRKPRPKYDLSVEALNSLRDKVTDADRERVDMLIDLISMGILKAAKKWNYSPQGLGKIRKKYVEGQWPITITV